MKDDELQKQIKDELKRLDFPVDKEGVENINIRVNDGFVLWSDSQYSWFHRGSELLDELQLTTAINCSTPARRYSALCRVTRGSVIGEPNGGQTEEVKEAQEKFDHQANLY